MPHPVRTQRLAPLLATAALLACGEPKTAPAPFAELAGRYRLETVNRAPLPFNEGGSTWLFERRFEISGEGRFEEFDVFCVVNGETCPRQERARSGTMYRTNDGSPWLDYGASYSVSVTLDSTGRLEVVMAPAVFGNGGTRTYQYQRQ